ncbi:MAG TPA: hypothetical protein VMW47_12930 [Verrucomicrobiae bacterium]|nr:hypothetical protein [Verrucomicrobiae bacterium]
MSADAPGLAGAMRVSALAALASGTLVVILGLLIAGPRGAGLAGLGAGLGLLNLWVAAGALRRLPALVIGTSLPRLAVVTVVVLGLGLVLGPIAVWALVGLLVTHLIEVGAVLRYGLRTMAR